MLDKKSRNVKMIDAEKAEFTRALKEVKRLYKEFGVNAWILKGALAKGSSEK